MTRRLASLPLLLILLLLAPAGAQTPQSVDLRFNLAANDVLHYRFAESLRQNVQRETGQSRNELERDGVEEYRVIDVDAGGVMTLELRRQIQRLVVDGVSRSEPVGPALRARMTPLGSLLDSTTGEPTSQEVFVLLPERSVRVGENWTRAYEREQGRSRFAARETYVLTALATSAGRTIAHVRATHEFAGSGGRVAGLPETVEAAQTTRFTGDYAFDVGRGRLLRVSEETNEEIRFRGTVDNRPVQGLQTRVITRRTELTAP